MAQAGKWVVKTPIEIGVCRARPFALLFANQCSPIRSQVDLLVDTLHCKTEQRRASVLCQLGVQLAARRPIDIVGVISLIHRSICQSRLRSQPVRLAIILLTRLLFWQITHTQL